MLNSNPVEIRPETVVLDCGGTPQEIPNDYAWIFAGGVAPDDVLKKIGVQFGSLLMTKKEADSDLPTTTGAQ